MTPPKFLIVPLALLAAACQSDGGGSSGASAVQACRYERVTDVPARLVQGHILVPAAINHTPVQLIVDTGATTSMLTTEAVASLGLPTDPFRTTTVHGTGGVVVTHDTSIQSFRLGSEDWLGSSMTTGHLPSHYQEEPPVVGLLGADRLTEFDVELDLPQQRMTLWRVQHCDGNFVPWKGPHYSLTLARYQPNRMVARVIVNGQSVAALVDWGARSTVLTTIAASRLGVTADMLAQDRSGISHGVDQNDVAIHLHRFDEVTIGAAHFHDAALQVATLQVTDVGMLLGADFISRRHVWLSYASNQLFVQRGPDVVVAAAPSSP